MRFSLLRPQVSYLGCALVICNVWCVMLELLVYLCYGLMYIWCYLRFCMWLSYVFLLGRECAVLLSGHLSFIVLECVRDAYAMGVGLLCAAIWCSFSVMLWTLGCPCLCHSMQVISADFVYVAFFQCVKVFSFPVCSYDVHGYVFVSHV
jgi:hypothetical protein